jgi:hypothetical protein
LRENRGFRSRLLKNLTLVAFFPSLGGPRHNQAALKSKIEKDPA